MNFDSRSIAKSQESSHREYSARRDLLLFSSLRQYAISYRDMKQCLTL